MNWENKSGRSLNYISDHCFFLLKYPQTVTIMRLSDIRNVMQLTTITSIFFFHCHPYPLLDVGLRFLFPFLSVQGSGGLPIGLFVGGLHWMILFGQRSFRLCDLPSSTSVPFLRHHRIIDDFGLLSWLLVNFVNCFSS